MAKRHLRALVFSLTMTVLCGLPVFALWQTKKNDITADLKDLGEAPEFSFATDDGQAVFSKSDTYRRVSFLTFLNDECAQSTTCLEKVYTVAQNIKAYADDALTNKNKYDSKPQGINFYIFSRIAPKEKIDLPFILLSQEEKLPLPDGVSRPSESSFGILSQEARFKGILPASNDMTEARAKHLLGKLTAENYLLHYLTVQNLMWQKAKNYARGKID